MTAARRGWQQRPEEASRKTRRGPRRQFPFGLAVPSTMALLVIVAPLLALLSRAPWSRMGELLSADTTRSALTLSLGTSLLATGIALVVGIPLAALLARTQLPGRSLLRAVVMLPIVMPPVVGGLAVLYLIGRNGVAGRWLEAWFGVAVPFTPAAVVLAQIFVAMPYLVLAVSGALAGRDPDLEDAAATMGATDLQTFRYITLPLVGPAVATGALLSFARALGEFAATITVAGNVPGVTQTMPTAVYLALQTDPETAVALGVVMLAVAVLAVFAAGVLSRSARTVTE